ncbi:MAG: hypothetical protein RMJ44_10285 [Cytophagales bacterium]|nr:hypothetical protein [Bernardetiaceae bacterium]MDW8211465.1 hypothetical protein [Cytophagales bacterium]
MGIIACKNTTITGALTQSWRYDYTYYYSWLKQHEEILCDYQSDDGYYLLLTSKHLQICSRTLKRSFPLQKVNSINLQFKRLMLPLIIGGIIGPFSALATYQGLLTYWIGVGLTLSGFLLVYYGWLGSWQINVVMHTHTLHYFTDHKTPHLEEFIQAVNRRLEWFQAK